MTIEELKLEILSAKTTTDDSTIQAIMDLFLDRLDDVEDSYSKGYEAGVRDCAHAR